MDIKIQSGLSDELRMLRGVEPITPTRKGASTAPANGASFSDFLSQQINEVNQLGLDAENKMKRAVEGKASNPHDVQIAIQKADVAFKLMLSVKEQLEQAYQTVMRTSIG
jgi:flagellar hook-basal body complex protein FliE